MWTLKPAAPASPPDAVRDKVEAHGRRPCRPAPPRRCPLTQRVVITAGASGIGLAMATAFADTGAQVWVTDVDAAAVAALPEEIRGTVVDAADEPAMAAFFAAIRVDWGGLDVLCANAGIKGPTALIEDIALYDWRACTAVNLDGAFLAAKYRRPDDESARDQAR